MRSIPTSGKSHRAWLNAPIIFTIVMIAISGGIVSGAGEPEEDWNEKGIEYYQQGEYEEALLAYTNATRENPEDEVIWYNIGLAYESLERYDDALSAFDRSVVINPDYSDAWREKGLILNTLGRSADALAALEKAITSNPDDPDAWRYKGDVLKEIGKNKDAQAAYDQASSLESETDIPVELQTGEDSKSVETPVTGDQAFDQLYQSHYQEIDEGLHQLTAWIGDQNWNEADKKARSNAQAINSYVQELESLQVSHDYSEIRDSYVFFLRQLYIANTGVGEIASLYPVYFSHGNPNYHNPGDDADYVSRLQSVIDTLGTAQKEYDRFSRLY